jgi:hypothetical protein
MNKILTAIATITMLTLTTSVFAADIQTSATPAPTAKPSVAETTAKHKQREKEARAAKSAAAASKKNVTEPPADEAIEKARAEKLQKRSKAAKKNSKGANLQKEKSPIASPTVK